MILATTISAERGKEITKTANEWIKVDITAQRRKVGQLDISIDNENELVIDFTNDEEITKTLVRGILKTPAQQARSRQLKAWPKGF
jgi:hypothetical protein